MTTNPERLWAFTCDGSRGIRSVVASADAEGVDAFASMQRNPTKPAEYVLASTAAAEREAAVKAALAYDQGPMLVTIKAQGDKIEARQAEAEALRRERDALAARVEKLRTEMQNIVDESDISEHSTVRVESMAALADQALTKDDALAGLAAKGVG